MGLFKLIWLGGIFLVILVIGWVVIKQIAHDLKEREPSKRGEYEWDDGENNRPIKRKDNVYPGLERFKTLLAAVFSLLIFGLIFELFLEDSYKYAVSIQDFLGYPTIAFLLAITSASAYITKLFMETIEVDSNHIQVTKGKSIVIAGLSFILYLLLFSFFNEFSNPEYNLVKGVTISFSLGVLFYIIFEEDLNFSFIKWTKKSE